MDKTQTKIHQRVNITLPKGTLRLIDRVVEKGNRSRLINEAVHFYIERLGHSNLKRQLKEGAIRHAQRDLSLSKEWFALEEELCPKS